MHGLRSTKSAAEQISRGEPFLVRVAAVHHANSLSLASCQAGHSVVSVPSSPALRWFGALLSAGLHCSRRNDCAWQRNLGEHNTPPASSRQSSLARSIQDQLDLACRTPWPNLFHRPETIGFHTPRARFLSGKRLRCHAAGIANAHYAAGCVALLDESDPCIHQRVVPAPVTLRPHDVIIHRVEVGVEAMTF